MRSRSPAERDPRLHLAVIGDDPAIERSVRRRLGSAVTLLGPFDPTDSPRCTRPPTSALSPSLADLFGQWILEAPASGLPVSSPSTTGTAAELMDHGEATATSCPGIPKVLLLARSSGLPGTERSATGCIHRQTAWPRAGAPGERCPGRSSPRRMRSRFELIAAGPSGRRGRRVPPEAAALVSRPGPSFRRGLRIADVTLFYGERSGGIRPLPGGEGSLRHPDPRASSTTSSSRAGRVSQHRTMAPWAALAGARRLQRLSDPARRRRAGSRCLRRPRPRRRAAPQSVLDAPAGGRAAHGCGAAVMAVHRFLSHTVRAGSLPGNHPRVRAGRSGTGTAAGLPRGRRRDVGGRDPGPDARRRPTLHASSSGLTRRSTTRPEIAPRRPCPVPRAPRPGKGSCAICSTPPRASAKPWELRARRNRSRRGHAPPSGSPLGIGGRVALHALPQQSPALARELRRRPLRRALQALRDVRTGGPEGGGVRPRR